MIKSIKTTHGLIIIPYLILIGYFILNVVSQNFFVSLIECLLLAAAIMISVYHAEEISRYWRRPGCHRFSSISDGH